jgi:hypothetical protein
VRWSSPDLDPVRVLVFADACGRRMRTHVIEPPLPDASVPANRTPSTHENRAGDERRSI